MRKLEELNPKQQRFVREYVIDLNATQAAIRAGYSAKTAEQLGFQLLKKTSVVIDELLADINTRLGVTAERTLLEYKRIGYGNPRNLMSWGQSGVVIRSSDDLTEDEAAMVAEVIETLGTVTTTEDGDRVSQGGSIKIKTHDKMAALKVLAIRTGLIRDGGSTVNVDARTQNLIAADDLIRALLKAADGNGNPAY